MDKIRYYQIGSETVELYCVGEIVECYHQRSRTVVASYEPTDTCPAGVADSLTLIRAKELLVSAGVVRTTCGIEKVGFIY